ncbi:MAG: type IV pilus modification PilV family protein [Janthinobacterium lividum]
MHTQRTNQFVSRRRSARGFTITEVALALIIFAMMTIMFAAVFPMTVRGAQYSGNYSQAAMLTQHKMDQIRSAGFGSLTRTALQNLSIIDTTQPSGYPASVTGGTTYSFTTADTLVNNGTGQGYFPPGSVGTVTICDYAALHPSSGVPTGKMDYVTVTLTWTGGGVSKGSYSSSALIANIT